MNSDKMTARVAGALYYTEKRNVLDWLRDKMTARTAGLLYFVNGAAGFFSYMIVPKKLIVQGNATATANNILASEMLFRVGIVSELVGAVAFIFLAITLEDNGETLLTGPVVDQAALHGLLKKVRDVAMPLISVIRVKPGQADASDVKQ